MYTSLPTSSDSPFRSHVARARNLRQPSATPPNPPPHLILTHTSPHSPSPQPPRSPQPPHHPPSPQPAPPGAPSLSEAVHQLAQALELPCLRRLRLIEERLTHQADDQPVALVGAHAMLELIEDLVLVLDVAALRLRIGRRGLAEGPHRAGRRCIDTYYQRSQRAARYRKGRLRGRL